MESNNFKTMKNMIGRHVYLLTTIDKFVMTTTKREMTEELNALEEDVVEELISVHDLYTSSLIYGLVLNPLSLPYELPENIVKEGLSLFLYEAYYPNGYTTEVEDIVVDITRHENIYSLVTELEVLINQCDFKSDDEILENIVVVCGKPLPMKFKLEITDSLIPVSYKDLYNEV